MNQDIVSIFDKIGNDFDVIADICTGKGTFVENLLNYKISFSQLYMVDIKLDYLRLTRKFGRDERIKYMCADAHKLPFLDESIDFVSIANSLHHLEQIDIVLEEVERVLKANGYFFIIEELHSDHEDTLIYQKCHKFISDVDVIRGKYHMYPFPIERFKMNKNFMLVCSIVKHKKMDLDQKVNMINEVKKCLEYCATIERDEMVRKGKELLKIITSTELLYFDLCYLVLEKVSPLMI